MLVIVPCKTTLYKDDLIALTKDGKFKGYGQVIEILDKSVLMDIDKQAIKMFNELEMENIPYNFDIL